MADISRVYQATQLGKETTPGTGVAANKLLLGTDFGRIQPRGAGQIFGAQGSKLNTVAVPPGDEHCEVPFQGPLNFNDAIYILDSAIKQATPSADGTNGKKWVHSLSRSASDTKTTYTLEQGNGVHAQKFTYAHVASLQIEISRRAAQLSGLIRGQRIQDDITITPTPTEIAQKVVVPQNFDVKFAATQAGLAGASVFARPFMVVISIQDLVLPLFRMNSGDASFITTIEQKPKITAKVRVGADDADMAFFTDLRAGSTQFIQVKALGEAIAGAMASQYQFTCEFAGAVVTPYDPAEDAGAAMAEWNFENIYDPTWGKSIEFTTINALASL